jgi:hypothetical protein
LSSDTDSNNGPLEARIAQYERLAEDWRFHHKLIWEIPAVAVTIMTGILAVSYSQLQSYPRLILLSLGAVLLFGFATAAGKHRFGADYRSAYIVKTESELKVLPLRTEESIQKMKDDKKALTHQKMKDDKKALTDSRLSIYGLLLKLSAEKLLIRLVFWASMLMIGLALLQLITIIGLAPDISPLKTS